MLKVEILLALSVESMLYALYDKVDLNVKWCVNHFWSPGR